MANFCSTVNPVHFFKLKKSHLWFQLSFNYRFQTDYYTSDHADKRFATENMRI